MRIRMENIAPDCIRVCIDNKRIGEFVRNDDGYFIFFLDNYRGGGFQEWLLRELADELKRINEPWDKIVQSLAEQHDETESRQVVHALDEIQSDRRNDGC